MITKATQRLQLLAEDSTTGIQLAESKFDAKVKQTGSQFLPEL